MTTKPLPPHGTYARSAGRAATGIGPCHCDACRPARARYRKRLLFLHANNRPMTVSAQPAAEHLRALLAGGAGWAELVTATGAARGTISLILAGKRTNILASSAAGILGVRLEDVLSPVRPVPAVGSGRRLQALFALAHSRQAIAEACGISTSLVSQITNMTRARIPYATTQAVATGYNRLSMREGTSADARRRAAQAGWAPPLAWDEHTIDDPDARPNLGRPVLRSVAIAEDAEFIRSTTGATDEQIAMRLGMPKNTLQITLRRAQRREQVAA